MVLVGKVDFDNLLTPIITRDRGLEWNECGFYGASFGICLIRRNPVEVLLDDRSVDESEAHVDIRRGPPGGVPNLQASIPAVIVRPWCRLVADN